MTQTTRFRSSALTAVTRNEHGDGLPGFTGHAAVFSQPTLIGTVRHGFVEEIAPGAFSDVLDDDVRFLFDHKGPPMARTVNGTLRLAEDATGLKVDADFADTQLSRDQVALLERGDVSDMSFGFNIGSETRSEYEGPVDEWQHLSLFTINTVARLLDVSTVTYPAYPGTDAATNSRSVTVEDIERRLETTNIPVAHLVRPVLSSHRGLPPRRWVRV